MVSTKGSLPTPVGPAVLIGASLPLTITLLDTGWLTHLHGYPLRLCSAPPSCLPTPPEPASLGHDELYHLPTGIIFPHLRHHLSQHLWRLNCFPSSPPPHHTPSSPPSLSHHRPPSPAPPTITLNTALVLTPALPSYPHPTPNHRGISLLTGLCAVFPPACLLPLSPPYSQLSPPSMNIY